MPLTPGQILSNRYRIVKLLGQGGFGAVYRAWDMTFEIPCAVKENFEISSEAQRQFEREAKLLRILRHPNLPQVSDYFSFPSQGQYLVMDYIEGQDLEELVHQSGGLPEAKALPWLLQVCDALEYLHSQTPPVIHRDIKPANIRISPKGQAFLVDFGIAKIFDPSRRTSTGARAATPGFAPIEQYKQSGTDARSDIYSFGATMYFTLTGQCPPESIDRLIGTFLIQPRQLNSAISPSVETAVLKAMELVPGQRFQRVIDLAAALRPEHVTGQAIAQTAPIVGGGIQTSQLVTPQKPQTIKSPTASRRVSWGLIFGIVALSVIILGGISWLATYLSDRAHQQSSDQTVTALKLLLEQLTSTPNTLSPTSLALPSFTPVSLLFYTSTPLALSRTPLSPTLIPSTPTIALTSTGTPYPTMINDTKGIKMALISAGSFRMGSLSRGQTIHTIYLDTFYIDVYEVTNAHYAECVQAGICLPPKKMGSNKHSYYYNEHRYADYPVIYVDWNAADTFCTKWRGGRLPTEAEWEKAARGGLEDMEYPWGNDKPLCTPGALNGANHRLCSKQDPVYVGIFSPNGHGLYDMAGNVDEWVADWYQRDYYDTYPADNWPPNPTGPVSGTTHILRGGSWASESYSIDVSGRWDRWGDGANFTDGFRCALSP
jgi:serine/threonine protein kinase